MRFCSLPYLRKLSFCANLFTQRKEIGPENCEFAFPVEVLTHIRALAPGNDKGEIREVGTQNNCFVPRVTAQFY